MTVAELIRELTRQDGDALVYFEERDSRLPVRSVNASHRWVNDGAAERREPVVVLKVGRR